MRPGREGRPSHGAQGVDITFGVVAAVRVSRWLVEKEEDLS